VGASVGIALAPQHGKNIIELLKCAEMAMYEAKKLGGGFSRIYDAETGERQHHRLRMGMRLEEAIRNEQLTLAYQPKVDLQNARLSGAEALLRWQDRELGWVSPAEFIPLAEERGLILMLGDLVLKKACQQLKDWEQQGSTLGSRLAINVSPAQMADPGFAQRAIEITEKAGGLPSQIELEITESAMMHEPELALFNAHVLCEAGFILSIDDFGTGYSSLARLHTFPVRKLKIDISFIRDMLSNPGHQTIVTAVIGMASALGLETVAEGVETPAQAAQLRHLACNTAQGYLFSQPLAPSDFAAAWILDNPLNGSAP
jgi:EAL domain-containing protein (putative c-di-GMP-specific phosphodiesterase class I)